MAHELDNPVWHALGSVQREFGERAPFARAFFADVSPLAAVSEHTGRAFDDLAHLPAARQLGLLYDSPSAPTPGWTVVRSAPLWQMVLDGEPPPENRGIPLGADDAPEIMALADLTQPGPFAARTWQLGSFIGIRDDGCLVSMAGERIRLPGYTEISAVCSHPDHTGRGYAVGLVATLAHRICERGEIAFLHVRQDNQRAVSLYERLGFRIRRALQYAILERGRVGRTKDLLEAGV
jgi:GNAT superfamily N-acetyltransferase